jgi:arsenical pump membrane protein
MGFALVAVVAVMLLVLGRPRVFGSTVEPAAAVLVGTGFLAAGGFVRAHDVVDAAAALWPAVIGIGSVMVLSAGCARAGALDLFACAVEARVPGTTRMLFGVVFFGGWISAGVLNNDAAVVVNTALVASLLRRRFAAHPAVAEPFLLAAFLGAGVAPLVVSNPMNLTVAHLAGIDFLVYARFMVPVSVGGAVVTFAILAVLYRRELAVVAAPVRPSALAAPGVARAGLALLAMALVGYAVCAARGWPTWPVSLAAALAAVAWFVVDGGVGAGFAVVREGLAWRVLIVLPIVFVFAIGLRRAGAIEAFAPALRHTGAVQVGVCSAIGSALLNNHTMAMINVAALLPGAGLREVFAALIGGDLGPRFLPFGSLAGLLWLEALRQQGHHVALSRFMLVGVLTGLPTLLACLLLVRLVPG